MYLQDLLPVSNSSPHFGFIELEFNTQIDFAIWVLIESGIQVSPFDLHPVETSLQNSLMKPEQWDEWLATLVAVFDPRWLCKVENFNSEIELELAQYQSFINNYSNEGKTISSLDWVAIRNHIEQRYAWKQLQYAQVTQEYGQQLVKTLSPITYWKHHDQTEIYLSQIWDRYHNNRHENLNINQIMGLSKNLCYFQQDTIKKFYLVNYPIFVQHQVSSTTTIVGICQSQEIDLQFLLQSLNLSVSKSNF
ncbi:MAG: hypothetical protein KME21_29045 [Desmonostoc vinosum HA7617-LM4]|jgi:hypothetical protein|nr:hypothetical protein [Desmonostoc vinosum HA7617-LM4]